MKGIKKIFANINIKEFKKYLFFSILLLAVIILFGKSEITKSRYENETAIRIKPSIAFFIVDVQSQTGQIKLEEMVPSTSPYLYSFNISNFHNNKHANVDLTYSVEIITTTNMPLDFHVYRDSVNSANVINTDTTTTNTDGMYFRHLVINGVNTMDYDEDVTDTFILAVDFPIQYKNNADDYAGIIDLVDIKINAEQVV
jgi:hypothetical protein